MNVKSVLRKIYKIRRLTLIEGLTENATGKLFWSRGEVSFTLFHFYIKQTDRFGVTCFHVASDGCFFLRESDYRITDKNGGVFY